MDAAPGTRALTRAWTFGVVCLALAAPAASAFAQRAVQPEVRVDVLGPAPYAVQPGLGATYALGYYGRLSAAVGFAVRPDTNEIADRWRGDLLARFLLDPFRQRRWGASIGAGLSFRRRTYIAAVVEMESPESRGWLAAAQLGISGGLRAGIVLRRARPRRR